MQRILDAIENYGWTAKAWQGSTQTRVYMRRQGQDCGFLMVEHGVVTSVGGVTRNQAGIREHLRKAGVLA